MREIYPKIINTIVWLGTSTTQYWRKLGQLGFNTKRTKSQHRTIWTHDSEQKSIQLTQGLT